MLSYDAWRLSSIRFEFHAVSSYAQLSSPSSKAMELQG